VNIVQNGATEDVWGTSAAAPLWAGLTAVLDQQLEASPDGKALGFFNPILYQELQGAGLTDVVSGTNATSAVTTDNSQILMPTNIGYTAKTGWDMTTGWGVPDGTTLLTDLENLLKKKN
jgi:kumamolisin